MIVEKNSAEQLRDCKIIELSDITGDYNVNTNPTGYNNPAYSFDTSTNVLRGAWLSIQLPGESSYYNTLTLNSSQAINLADQTAKYSITNSILGGSSLDPLEDGVYKILYAPFMGGDDESVLSGTAGTNRITITGTIANFIGVTHIQPQGVGKVYEIATISGNDIVLTEDLEATASGTGLDANIGFGCITYIACTCLINKCIHTKTASIACSSCGCKDDKIEENTDAIMMFFGIQTNMDKGNYKCAQDIINALTLYCSDNDCGC